MRVQCPHRVVSFRFVFTRMFDVGRFILYAFQYISDLFQQAHRAPAQNRHDRIFGAGEQLIDQLGQLTDRQILRDDFIKKY